MLSETQRNKHQQGALTGFGPFLQNSQEMINPFLIRVILWNDKNTLSAKPREWKLVWGLEGSVSEFEKLSYLGPFPQLKVSSQNTAFTHSFVHQFVHTIIFLLEAIIKWEQALNSCPLEFYHQLHSLPAVEPDPSLPLWTSVFLL